ncbi:MAG: PAS domain-containing protein [Marinobacterium sp.]|nr:PAS domain-containing protein [Marinobacterium sp.]
MSSSITPRQSEIILKDDDLIVSKTCLKGTITYANRRFMQIAGFSEQQLLRQPHNLIRHPDMPRGVYRLMWKTLREDNEFFGFVKNLCSDGSFYWVFANVTPDIDEHGQTRGFYSVRRKAPVEAIRLIEGLYSDMRSIEATGRGSAVIDQSVSHLANWLEQNQMEYFPAMLHLYRHGSMPGV